MKAGQGTVRGLSIVIAFCWSCGIDRLSSYDDEPLTAAQRQTLTDDASRVLHGFDALTSFIATTPLPSGLQALPCFSVRGCSPGSVERVEAPSCVAQQWSTASGYEEGVGLAGCALPTGEELSGSAVVDFGSGELSGLRSLSFERLELGAFQLEGYVTASAASAGGVGLGADLRVMERGRSVRLILGSGQLTVAGSRVVLDARGIFSDASGIRYEFTASGLASSRASCYPEAGTFELKRGSETLTIRFEGPDSAVLTSSRGLAETLSLTACL